jgi:hypothetical protein
MSDILERLPIRVVHTRSATPTDADMTIRPTAANPGADAIDPATVYAQDTASFLHGWNGTGWDRVRVVNNTALSVHSDGIYNAVSNIDPANTGLILCVRNASPADAQQTFRTTGGNPTADGLTAANIYALDTASFLHGWNGTGWDRMTSTDQELDVHVDGVYNLSTNPTPDNVGLIAHTRNETPGLEHQNLRLTGIIDAGGTVRALDVAIRDESGNPYTAANPLPVTSVDSEGTEVNDYNTAASVAAGATSNHDYTVTAATTLKLTSIWASSSGRMKIEVQVESGVGTNLFNTRFVAFKLNDSNIFIDIKEHITVAAGVRVRVIRTNRDLLAADVYSTISGHEIA